MMKTKAFYKIDSVLKYLINCNYPPRRTDREIIKELKEVGLSSKELIEILDKLTKDNYVIKEIGMNNTAYYFSSFEGRLFFDAGGYMKFNQREVLKKNANVFVTVLTIVISIVIAVIGYLNYKVIDKENNNVDVLKFNNSIQHSTTQKVH